MSLILLNDIVKHYVMGQETVRALDGVSLRIAANEYVASPAHRVQENPP